MRIHDSMLEINTRLKNYPHTSQNAKGKTASPGASEFSECLQRVQATSSAAETTAEAHAANVVWVRIPFLPRENKLKSDAYRALSDI